MVKMAQFMKNYAEMIDQQFFISETEIYGVIEIPLYRNKLLNVSGDYLNLI